MIPYTINIEKINNGFIVSWEEDWSEKNKLDIRVEKEVVEEEYPPKDHPYYKEEQLDKLDEEQYTMKKLLETVANHFGICYDKYNRNNLKITFDKEGHKI